MRVLFGLFSLRFGLMDRAIRVIGWRVDRVDFQLLAFGCVNDIMMGPGRDNDRVTAADKMLLTATEDEFGLAFLDAEELIHVIMHFAANFLTWPQTHHHQLGVFPGEQHFAEECVLYR